MRRWSLIENNYYGESSYYETDYDDRCYEDENYSPKQQKLKELSELYYNSYAPKGYSRGSKKDLEEFMLTRASIGYSAEWLPYYLVGISEKAKTTIKSMERHKLSEAIIAHQLEKMGFVEQTDWKWEFDKSEFLDEVDYGGDYDWEEAAYVELGGDINEYRSGCVNDFGD